MLLIEGILWAIVRGDGFSDKGEVSVFDTFGEDFLFEDFSVGFDEFGLVGREDFQGVVEAVDFDDLAKSDERAIR